jgi:hypothetical protein
MTPAFSCWRAAATVFAFALCGCEGKSRSTMSLNQAPETQLPSNHPQSTVEQTPPEVATTSGRAPRRVSIEQLRASFPVVFGNDLGGAPITWTNEYGENGFSAYAGTLGEPDYADTTDENLDPSPLYVKFMDDAARNACGKALEADYGRTDPASRVIIRHAGLNDLVTTSAQAKAAIEKNLRYLRLRFHGIKVAATEDQPIATLRDLFTQSAQANAGSAKEGWRAVCVALTVAPEFHLY